MTGVEIKILEKLRTDPAAIEIAVDYLQRLDAGESAESILTSYGINLKEIGS